MSEIRSIISGATSKSLVLIDEICRGTETAKGTCIAGSIIETLDTIGCLGIVSSHLHGIFNLPLKTKNTVYKAMGTEYINGQTKPTWKLIDGICKESLAFETAQKEGIPDQLIQRAEELYLSLYAKDAKYGKNVESSNDDQTSGIESGIFGAKIESMDRMEILMKEVESAITLICQNKLNKLYKQKTSMLSEVKCVLIGAKEQPPPSTIGHSTVYVIIRQDKKLYVGEVLLVSRIILLYPIFC